MEYSVLLLDNIENKFEIINDFSEIQNLNPWLWETYFVGSENNVKEFSHVCNEVKNTYKLIADKYNLTLLID